MITKMTITPKFDVHRWARKKIESTWLDFQARALDLGKISHAYMINYIMSHKKRGQSPHVDGTMPLEKSIKLDILATAPARISWGIGNISVLQTQSPYWYVLNYGKTVGGRRFIPGGGKAVPGFFQPSGAPMGNKRNGREAFVYSPGTFIMYPKQAIRPINYIQATQFRVGREMRRILATLRRIK